MTTRRILILTLAMLLAFSFTFATAAFANAPQVSVTVDGARVTFADQQPVIVDGRTLVPINSVFEHMGYEVDWDAYAEEVTITNGEYTVVLTVGSSTFTTNGASRSLDVPVQLIGDRTMLPVRAVLESIGYHVYWDHANRTVMILSVSAMDLLVKSQDAMQEVGEFESVFETRMYVEEGGQTVSMLVTGEMTSFANPLKVKQVIETVLSDGIDTMETKMEIYMIHEGDYIKMYMYSEGEWSRLTMPFSQELLEEMMRLPTADLVAELFDDVQIVGTERISGIDTWKINYTMNMAGSIAIIEGMMQGMDELAELLTEDMFAGMDDITATMWIAKDGFYQVKMVVDMTDILAAMMEGLGATVSNVLVSITSSNFGNATPFELPAGAADAVEIELPQ